MADDANQAAASDSENSPSEAVTTVRVEPAANDEDANLNAILDALADEKWDFRTVDGLSKTTGLDRDVVISTIEAHPEAIRKSAVPDRKGRALYTLRSRSPGFMEILASARAFITKST